MTAKPENLRYYSQHGEDQLLWDFFERKSHGTYIDIGAFDGRYLSNTYSFYQQGWRGVCVEPHPEYFKRLETNRPEDHCINAVCTHSEGKQVLFRTELVGLYSTASSGEQVAAQIASRYSKNNFQFDGLEEHAIQSTTLSHAQRLIAESGQEIDFVSIDVEGLELEVLEAFEQEIKPRFFVIEENTEASRNAIRDKMVNGYGYTLARRAGINGIYSRSNQDAIRLRDIPIRCSIEKVLHPLGAEFTLDAYREGLIIDEQAATDHAELKSAAITLSRLQRSKELLGNRIEELNSALSSQQTKNAQLHEEQLKASSEAIHTEWGRQMLAAQTELREKVKSLEKQTGLLEAALQNKSSQILGLESRNKEIVDRLKLLGEQLARAESTIEDLRKPAGLNAAMRKPINYISNFFR